MRLRLAGQPSRMGAWCKSSMTVFQAVDAGASPTAPATEVHRSPRACAAPARRRRWTAPAKRLRMSTADGRSFKAEMAVRIHPEAPLRSAPQGALRSGVVSEAIGGCQWPSRTTAAEDSVGGCRWPSRTTAAEDSVGACRWPSRTTGVDNLRPRMSTADGRPLKPEISGRIRARAPDSGPWRNQQTRPTQDREIAGASPAGPTNHCKSLPTLRVGRRSRLASLINW